MKSLHVGRRGLGLCSVAVMLAACGGSQPPSGVPGAFDRIAQNRSVGLVNASAPQLPERALTEPQYKVASPLMFVVNFSTPSGLGNVVVYDPKTNDPNPLAVITAEISSPNGDCVNSTGTLYVGSDPGSGPGWISEYAPGKTKPFKTITDGLDGPAFCAIDGQGNLWVTNNGGAANVTEYWKGSTRPHMASPCATATVGAPASAALARIPAPALRRVMNRPLLCAFGTFVDRRADHWPATAFSTARRTSVSKSGSL